MKNLKTPGLKVVVNLFIAICVITGMMPTVARAGLVGPYQVDGTTLHLWHFDETAGVAAYDSVSNNPQAIPITLTNVAGPIPATPTVFATNDQPSYALSTNGVPYVNYTNCILGALSAGYLSPYYLTNNSGQPPCIPIALPAYTNLSNFKATNTGAFTIEALIKPNFNPSSGSGDVIMADNNGGNGPSVPANTYANYAQIRGWWFNINGGLLTFFNIGASTASTNDYTAQIPTTGPDAGQTGQWYHMAVTYSGFAPTNGDTPKVYTLYWTLVDAARTNADALMSWTNTGVTNGIMGTPFLTVGCSGRINFTNGTVNWAGFVGDIDEVRISASCRHANQMMFTNTFVQEAPTLAGLSASNSVSVGSTLTLVPTEYGTSPITNQWYQISGGVTNLLTAQTNLDLVIANAGLTVGGTYFLVASNAYGRATSSLVTVSINNASFDALFNSGVNNSGVSLGSTAAGSYDQHWLIVQDPDPAGIGSNAVIWSTNAPINPASPAAGYAVDSATAAWIGPEENAGTVTGVYDYRTTFLIDQGSTANASLSGEIETSGTADVQNGGGVSFVLNGVVTNLPNGNYAGPNTVLFTLTNGFQAGSNTLDIILTNNATSIEGLLVENLSGSSVALSTAPTIYTQPAPETVNYGSTATFSVVALGAPQLSYAWRASNVVVAAASTANRSYSFTATNIALSAIKNGVATNYYAVVVANGAGSVTSSVALLTINCAPIVTSQSPAISTNPITLFAGSSPKFSVTATGPALYYQWFTNGVAVGGATNVAFTWTNIPAGTSSNYCVVSNAAGSATSLAWNITGVAVPTAPYPLAVLASSPLGYWRLDEPDDGLGDNNDGQICHDFVGGNNGLYTNTELGQIGYTYFNSVNTDPSETSAQFGAGFTADSEAYGIPVNFSAPTNSSTNFTIEVWALGGVAQNEDNGVVSKGYTNSEQFSLDCGSDTTNSANPTPHSYRFLVRDSSGGAHAVNSGVNGSGLQWHDLVGVCNETGGYVAFYIDGTLVGTNAITPGSGVFSITNAMLIGSKPSTATSNNNLQFQGYLDDVSVYSRALSATEVLSHYDASGVAPNVVTQPVNVTTNLGATVTFIAGLTGTPPLTNQWYSQNTGLIPGATNATLVLTDVQNNDSFYDQVVNAYGSTQSASATLTLVTAPVIGVDVPAYIYVLPGQTTSIPVTVYGAAPLAYQWQFNGANLTDNSRITGSQSSNVLTIADAQASDQGSYQVIITNAYGGPVTSSVTSLIVGQLPLGFNGNGQGWKANNVVNISSIAATNGLLTLTDGGANEARTFFFDYPQYIGAFQASFTYQDVNGGGADGWAFVLQNDPRGASAEGGDGGRLGVESGGGDTGTSITPSWELEFNIYTPAVVGYAMETDGAVGPPWLPTGYPGDANYAAETNMMPSGHPINVTLNYASGVMSLQLTDTVASVSFSTNIYIGNLPAIVGGSTAYVGFTAGDGGASSVQTITNFSFVSIPPEAIQLNGTNVLLSWPGNLAGYTVQENSDLTTTNWTTVTNVPSVINAASVTNSLNQIVVPVGTSNLFYRLILQ